MHDFSYAQAAVPERRVVLRTLLRPYSIGHELLLARYSNPIATLEHSEFQKLKAHEMISAVRLAVWLCAHTWRENTGNPKWLRTWLWTRRRENFPMAIADFRNYRASGSIFPPVPNEEHRMIASGQNAPSEGREIGSPFLARLYSYIAALPDREIRLHGDTAFDFPYGHACFLYFSYLENKGQISVENNREKQVREEMEGHYAAREAERLAALQKEGE